MSMQENGSAREKVDGTFSTEHVASDLKGLSARGGAATFSGQALKFVLNIGSTVILARILTPQDFGLVAMVTAVTAFIMVFKDLGLSMATVQRPEINHSQISALFWVNVVVGALLTIVTIALAPAIAWFYGEPRLMGVTAALAAAFLFSGLTVQHQALLRRQLRLPAVAVIDVTSMAAGAAAGIGAAVAGLGYWALVVMHLGTAVSNALGVWLAAGWVPGRPRRAAGVRSMLLFGGNMTGSGVLNYFSRNMDNVLIGRVLGAQAVGLYAKAYSLLLMPMAQITAPMTAVAVPGLSRLQASPGRYIGFYLKALKIVGYLSMPLVASLGVLAPEVVWIVLGEQWAGAVPIFRVLAVAAFWQAVGATVGWVYVSLDQTRRMLKWASVDAPLTVLAFVMGLQWGAIGVAGAYSVFTTLKIVPQFWYAYAEAPIRLRDALLALRYPVVTSAVAGAVMMISKAQFESFGPIAVVLGGGAATIIALLVLGASVGRIRRDVREVLDLVVLAFENKKGDRAVEAPPATAAR